ncbi:MAG: integrase [Gammaproteobacteria bacterium]|nr:MAG: integrase [Gammaproteobacteria bacterium]
MEGITVKLVATQIKQAKPRDRAYKLSDGGGLFLLVNPNGSKYWRLKYRYAGKEKKLALGVYPKVTLANARKAGNTARDQIQDGIDPGAVRRIKKLEDRYAGGNTFRAIALEWYGSHMADKVPAHRSRTKRLLEKNLFPVLGNRPINDITAPEVLIALRKVEARGALDMAHRAKQTAGQVFRYAVATGRCERDPSRDLDGALPNRKKKHHAAITDPAEVGKLLLAIDSFAGTEVVRVALQLSPLLFQRPGEIRAMEWGELDLDAGVWEIPADKMKMRQPHIVPLATQAVALLEGIQGYTGRGKYVFPSARGDSRSLSDNAVRVALRTMGFDKDTMTPHGFRAMARTILDEVLGVRVDLIEHQLAHAVRDANGRAYNRTAHLPARRTMMQDWANYLDNLKAQASSGNVITAKFGGGAA